MGRKSGQYLATYERDSKTFKIWVEDADSINLKSSLAHKYNLSGVASWSRGFETPDVWPVLNKSLKSNNSYQEWLNNNRDKWYVK